MLRDCFDALRMQARDEAIPTGAVLTLTLTRSHSHSVIPTLILTRSHPHSVILTLAFALPHSHSVILTLILTRSHSHSARSPIVIGVDQPFHGYTGVGVALQLGLRVPDDVYYDGGLHGTENCEGSTSP